MSLLIYWMTLVFSQKSTLVFEIETLEEHLSNVSIENNTENEWFLLNIAGKDDIEEGQTRILYSKNSCSYYDFNDIIPPFILGSLKNEPIILGPNETLSFKINIEECTCSTDIYLEYLRVDSEKEAKKILRKSKKVLSWDYLYDLVRIKGRKINC